MSTPPGSEPLVRALFAALADGALHSGADLAAAHGVTRGGVWKAIENLRQQGLPVLAVPNRGYFLAHAVAPLSAPGIVSQLRAEHRARIDDCVVLWSAGSTNSLMLEMSTSRPGMLRILLAENQQSGRGRRGRAWQAALGSGLSMSLGFGVDALPRDFGGLTLAVGLAVQAALTEAGAQPLAVKWPNDMVSGPRKIGGILTELRAEAGGPAWVVCGIGLNVRLPGAMTGALEREGALAGDLVSLGLRADRNALAARVIDHCIDDISLFLDQGLAPFQARWRAHDALSGRQVRVESAGHAFHGRACGIDESGALLVDNASGRTAVVAGDVSVRSDPEQAE
jgi:BirA family biotin operon repressor/biotin-[acetyl-CoA-carboxylase] ligase